MDTQTSVPVVENEVEVEAVEQSLTVDEREELEELQRYEATLAKLSEYSEECDRRVAEATLELKDAKQERDSARAAVQRAIREHQNDKDLPLWQKKTNVEDDKPDESYRLVSIDTLGLPPKVCELLRENVPSLSTIGAIQDWLGDADHVLQDVKGLGTAKVTMVEEALEQFWKRRQQQQFAKQAAAVAAAPDEDEDDDA